MAAIVTAAMASFTSNRSTSPTDQQAFFTCTAARVFASGFGIHLDHAVQQFGLEVLGDKARANALNLVRTWHDLLPGALHVAPDVLRAAHEGVQPVLVLRPDAVEQLLAEPGVVLGHRGEILAREAVARQAGRLWGRDQGR